MVVAHAHHSVLHVDVPLGLLESLSGDGKEGGR